MTGKIKIKKNEAENRMWFSKPPKGFTLIEIMIAMAIIGILAAISLQQYNKFQNDAKRGSVFASFANMSLAQENYYHLAIPGMYTRDMTRLMDAGFVPTPNVTILILTSDGRSWQAHARYIGTQEVYEYDSLRGGVQPDPIIVP